MLLFGDQYGLEQLTVTIVGKTQGSDVRLNVRNTVTDDPAALSVSPLGQSCRCYPPVKEPAPLLRLSVCGHIWPLLPQLHTSGPCSYVGLRPRMRGSVQLEHSVPNQGVRDKERQL